MLSTNDRTLTFIEYYVIMSKNDILFRTFRMTDSA